MADFLNNTQPQQQRGGLIRVMGLWEEKDQNGNTMLSGNLSGRTRVSITANSFKKSEREPDYYLHIVQIERQENPGEESQQPQEEPQVRASIRLNGLWHNRDRKGKDYLSGSLQSMRILIFSNNYHQSDRDPDYILYVCQSDRQQGQGGQGGFAPQGGGFGGFNRGSNPSDNQERTQSTSINEYEEPPF